MMQRTEATPAGSPVLQAAIEARYSALCEGHWAGDEHRRWIPGDVEKRLRTRAAREVHAERAAALEVLRQQEYQRAEEAATAAGTPLNAEMRMHAYHIVDLALMDPVVTISWLKPGTRSEKLVRVGNAVSFPSRGAIVIPAIRTIEDVNCGEHEVGHQRTPNVIGKLERERAAWIWVLEHCLFWDWSRHAHKCRCLMSYADAAKIDDVLGVLAIEQLCAPATFRRYERPQTAEMVPQFEARLFEQQHGRVLCQCGKWCAPGTIATATDADRLVCPACALALKADRSVRMQRMWRAAMRARKAACFGS